LLRHQNPFSDIADSVIALIDQAELIVAHNVKFDAGFLNAELSALGQPAIDKPLYCTMEGYRATNGGGSAGLDAVTTKIGLSRGGARHGALEDAWLAMMVYFWLHGCPYRMPFSVFSNLHPSNLVPTPPMPDQAKAIEQTLAKIREMFSRTDAAPPAIGPAFSPSGLDVSDGIDLTTTVSGPGNDDLRGITIAIKYTDSGERRSTRRITLEEVLLSDEGILYLKSFCHECNAPRTFRFDRIRSIIDLDGREYQPAIFFRDELRAPIPPLTVTSASPTSNGNCSPDAITTSEKPGAAQRRVARDGARVLAALARSDGLMHQAEIQVILDYIIECARRRDIPTNAEDRLALAAYLKRQRSTADILDECLARLARSTAEEQRLFLASAIALTDADGRRDTAEVAMSPICREISFRQFDLAMAGTLAMTVQPG
jgi:hypothetical protein